MGIVAAVQESFTAKNHEINDQSEPNPEPDSNDSKQLQVAGGGSASAAIGILIRNMHTQVEVADLQDAEHAVRLLTRLILELPEELLLFSD
ncbi:MAG: hypothetical protein EA378_03275 [Phycisphaerales bacterium]|nr:MAG: hypothetical protein EA378_03275 [Phycisphaerales bacterium]